MSTATTPKPRKSNFFVKVWTAAQVKETIKANSDRVGVVEAVPFFGEVFWVLSMIGTRGHLSAMVEDKPLKAQLTH